MVGKRKLKSALPYFEKNFQKKSLQPLSLTGLSLSMHHSAQASMAIGKSKADIIMAPIWPFWQGHHLYKVLTLGLTCSFGPVPSVLLSKGDRKDACCSLPSKLMSIFQWLLHDSFMNAVVSIVVVDFYRGLIYCTDWRLMIQMIPPLFFLILPKSQKIHCWPVWANTILKAAVINNNHGPWRE